MFKQILVTMDRSDMGKAVFERALSLAKNTAAHLMLLHVLSPEEDNSPLPVPPNLRDIYPAVGNDLTMETWRKQWQEFEQEGLKMLQSRAEEAMQAGVGIEYLEYQQISGSPAKAICQFAKNWQADLIVIGHRGRSGLSEMILGSVSNYVLHHAHCSVLIVLEIENREQRTGNRNPTPPTPPNDY